MSITAMTAERVELYRPVPPLGQPIPVGVQPFPVEDSISDEEEIAWELCRLCLNLSGGLSEFRAEHLRQWMIDATWDRTPDATN